MNTHIEAYRIAKAFSLQIEECETLAKHFSAKSYIFGNEELDIAHLHGVKHKIAEKRLAEYGARQQSIQDIHEELRMKSVQLLSYDMRMYFIGYKLFFEDIDDIEYMRFWRAFIRAFPIERYFEDEKDIVDEVYELFVIAIYLTALSHFMLPKKETILFLYQNGYSLQKEDIEGLNREYVNFVIKELAIPAATPPQNTDAGQEVSAGGGGDKPMRYKVDRKNIEKHRLTRETAERILKKRPNITQKELRVEARKGTGRGSFTQYICDDVWKDHKAKRKIERQT